MGKERIGGYMMKNFDEFYPTPESLFEIATEGCDFKRIETILEPSAGKGDIVEYLQKKAKKNHMEYDIDCIEIEEELRSILKGKNMRVIYDDFLTFHTTKHYDLICANFPFSNGDEHLWKALELQKNGGAIIAIINAETIRNPYTNRRKALIQKLEELDASITFHQEAFLQADRKTDVEVAIVKVWIPKKEFSSKIYEELKAAQLKDAGVEGEMTDVAENDYIKAIVMRYELECNSCLNLIREYRSISPYILSELKESNYSKPILQLKHGNHDLLEGGENRILREIRGKYWDALFKDKRFTGNMTSNQYDQYSTMVHKLKDYDFNLFNIKTIQIEMAQNLVNGIEECILKLFDELSHEYSWLPETGRNIHFYNGWATNKAHIINKKVIIPVYNIFSKIWNRFEYRYDLAKKLSDIEKVFNYLSGSTNADHYLDVILQKAEKEQQTKNINFKFFTVTFYKKGTCHITFKDEELLKKFNIYGSQKKGWLPPCYGKKSYEDMTKEEKGVIDEFEGKESYQEVWSHPDQYLLNFPEQIATTQKLLTMDAS